MSSASTSPSISTPRTPQAPSRVTVRLREGWRFALGDGPERALPGYDDASWQEVLVPHDWAISGAFDRSHDLQRTKIIENNEKVEYDHTGRTGGLPHIGTAWYRLKLDLPGEWQGKRLFLEFDGVMSNSSVYVNGAHAGSWPYGYSSFSFEVTDLVRPGSPNVIAVRVENKPMASRWYPGAGIYRNVRLVAVDPVHVAHWGVYITTPEVTEERAAVRVRTELQNQSPEEQDVTLRSEIVSPQGQVVAAVESSRRIAPGERFTFDQSAAVPSPVLWDIESPRLYHLRSTVLVGGEVRDECVTRFGIRTLRFDKDEGFFLNGRSVKFQGVCMHHDLGALGAAVNRRALQRQLEILKEMGCNAIRTAHNPPAPELLDLCDEMGFLVIDEAFDEWRAKKMKNGYHLLFEEWAERDLRAMIKRDRNHPSVIMWSIGNEMPDQVREEGGEIARYLVGICKDEDPTRPVTAGLSHAEGPVRNGLADALDIVGWNYKCHLYEKYREEHPGWILYGSETESTVSTRGEYYLPVVETRTEKRSSYQCTSYDVSAAPWGYTPEYEFAAQDDLPYLLGQFTWTGFDYLGEPTPYDAEWPSRSSYFGIVDLCGFPKDRFYLYRSRWRKDVPTLHLFPHWNWEGREGEIVPVHCYTSFDSAELFLNGRSLGVRTKSKERPFTSRELGTVRSAEETRESGLGYPYTRYRLMWDVPYEPGVLEVVAFDKDGRPAMRKKVVTAGPPKRVELVPDRPAIEADGEDLCFVTVRIVDAQGNLCPHAEHRVTFHIEGPGRIVALDNGDPTSLEPFVGESRRAFHGLCLAIVGSIKGEPGEIALEAHAEGLERARVRIVSRAGAAGEGTGA